MNRDNSYMQSDVFREAIRQGNLRRYAEHPMMEETKAKISQSNKGIIKTPEWCRHISEGKIGMPSFKKGKRGTPSPKKGKPQPSSSYKRSEETKRRMSESRKLMLQAHPEIMESVSIKLTGRVLSEETKQKTSVGKIQFFIDHPEAARAHSEKMKGRKNPTFSRIVKELWKTDYYIEMLMKARNTRPNKQEIKLGEILQELYPGHFKYNGDCRLGIVLNRCIPDFVNVNGKKQVVEFFGSYWHNQDGRGEQEKIARYQEVGWDCLVVWDTELSEADALNDKIRAFAGGQRVD